jgi:Schlafen, AlbA_2
VDDGRTDLQSLGMHLNTIQSPAYVRALLVRHEREWQLRHAWVLVGTPPPDWAEQTWTFASVILVSCEVPTATLATLCQPDSSETSELALGPIDVSVPPAQDGVMTERRPSFARFDRTSLPIPTIDHRISASDPNHASRQVLGGLLVGSDCPSFPDVNTAWRAFTEGDFSLSGAERLPDTLATVRVADLAAWLGPVHVTATHLRAEIKGTNVAGSVVELNGMSNRQVLLLERPGAFEFALEGGLPADAWLWLKRGTTWLDYRVLDPRLGWATQGDPLRTGVKTDYPIDPRTTLEAILSSGEGRQLEYKSKLPGAAARERRSALKTAAAFANGAGGTIIFGIDRDEVTVVGLEDDEADATPAQLRDRLCALVRATVVPTPRFDVQPYEVEGHTILVLSVEAGVSRPYGFVAAPDYRDKPEYFVRNGATTYHAQPSDLRESVGSATASAVEAESGWA